MMALVVRATIWSVVNPTYSVASAADWVAVKLASWVLVMDSTCGAIKAANWLVFMVDSWVTLSALTSVALKAPKSGRANWPN